MGTVFLATHSRLPGKRIALDVELGLGSLAQAGQQRTLVFGDAELVEACKRR